MKILWSFVTTYLCSYWWNIQIITWKESLRENGVSANVITEVIRKLDWKMFKDVAKTDCFQRITSVQNILIPSRGYLTPGNWCNKDSVKNHLNLNYTVLSWIHFIVWLSWLVKSLPEKHEIPLSFCAVSSNNFCSYLFVALRIHITEKTAEGLEATGGFHLVPRGEVSIFFVFFFGKFLSIYFKLDHNTRQLSPY